MFVTSYFIYTSTVQTENNIIIKTELFMIITILYLYPMVKISKFEYVVSARFRKCLKQKFPMRLGLCSKGYRSRKDLAWIVHIVRT